MGRKKFDGRVQLTALRQLRYNGFRWADPYEVFSVTPTEAMVLIEAGAAEHYHRPDSCEANAVELALRLRALTRQQEVQQ
jgi:hypothetical protein